MAITIVDGKSGYVPAGGTGKSEETAQALRKVVRPLGAALYGNDGYDYPDHGGGAARGNNAPQGWEVEGHPDGEYWRNPETKALYNPRSKMLEDPDNHRWWQVENPAQPPLYQYVQVEGGRIQKFMYDGRSYKPEGAAYTPTAAPSVPATHQPIPLGSEADIERQDKLQKDAQDRADKIAHDDLLRKDALRKEQESAANRQAPSPVEGFVRDPGTGQLVKDPRYQTPQEKQQADARNMPSPLPGFVRDRGTGNLVRDPEYQSEADRTKATLDAMDVEIRRTKQQADIANQSNQLDLDRWYKEQTLRLTAQRDAAAREVQEAANDTAAQQLALQTRAQAFTEITKWNDFIVTLARDPGAWLPYAFAAAGKQLPGGNDLFNLMKQLKAPSGMEAFMRQQGGGAQAGGAADPSTGAASLAPGSGVGQVGAAPLTGSGVAGLGASGGGGGGGMGGGSGVVGGGASGVTVLGAPAASLNVQGGAATGQAGAAAAGGAASLANGGSGGAVRPGGVAPFSVEPLAPKLQGGGDPNAGPSLSSPPAPVVQPLTLPPLTGTDTAAPGDGGPQAPNPLQSTTIGTGRGAIVVSGATPGASTKSPGQDGAPSQPSATGWLLLPNGKWVPGPTADDLRRTSVDGYMREKEREGAPVQPTPSIYPGRNVEGPGWSPTPAAAAPAAPAAAPAVQTTAVPSLNRPKMGATLYNAGAPSSTPEPGIGAPVSDRPLMPAVGGITAPTDVAAPVASLNRPAPRPAPALSWKSPNGTRPTVPGLIKTGVTPPQVRAALTPLYSGWDRSRVSTTRPSSDFIVKPLGGYTPVSAQTLARMTPQNVQALGGAINATGGNAANQLESDRRTSRIGRAY